jgi:hypothetical protein
MVDIDPVTAGSFTFLRTPKRSLNRGKLHPSVEQITGLSRDILKKKYPHLLIRASERCLGMTIGNALKIANGEAEAKKIASRGAKKKIASGETLKIASSGEAKKIAAGEV